MKRILMIATGGTLSCRQSEQGLTPALTGEQLVSFLPELANQCKVTVENLFSMDSTDLTMTHRVQIARLIYENYDAYDGFIVTHGTDTLAYTAALLYHSLRNVNKPVLITGAQKPIGVPGSDAERNLLDTFRVACAGYAGVAAVLHGHVMAGNHVVKVDCERMTAFRSVNAPLHGVIDDLGVVRLDFVPQPQGQLAFVEPIHSDLVVLKLVPDLDPSILSLLSRCQKVILESYGSGGIPARLEKAVHQLIQGGTVVYITTQCLFGEVDLSRYAVGQRAAAKGVVSLGSHTLEDAIAAIQCGEI